LCAGIVIAIAYDSNEQRSLTDSPLMEQFFISIAVINRVSLEKSHFKKLFQVATAKEHLCRVYLIIFSRIKSCCLPCKIPYRSPIELIFA
jgi:hypothetical protein